MRSTIALSVLLLITFAAAAIGGMASVDAAPFYAALTKPSWAPPSSLFGPVWSVLYLLMGFAVWLVWRESSHPNRNLALTMYAIQLGMNALWSWIFFRWHNGQLAFIEISALLIAIAVTVVLFFRVRRLAALLLVPYLLWIAFAAALTWSVWQGSPEIL